jgi:hypothetical protein
MVNRHIVLGLAMVVGAAIGARRRSKPYMPRPSRPPTTSRRSQSRTKTDTTRNIYP